MSLEINPEELSKNTTFDFYYKDYKYGDFDWSILTDLRDTGHERSWIAGGFLRRLMAGESVKGGDIDLWFAQQRMLPHNGILGNPTDVSKWAKSYIYKDYKVQIIKSRFTDPKHILNYFDFYTCWWYASVLDDIHEDHITIRTQNWVHLKCKSPGDVVGHNFRVMLPRDTNYLVEEVEYYDRHTGYEFTNIEAFVSPYVDTINRKLRMNTERRLRIFPNRFVKYLNLGMVPACNTSIELFKEYLVKGTEYNKWEKFYGIGRLELSNTPYPNAPAAVFHVAPVDGVGLANVDIFEPPRIEQVQPPFPVWQPQNLRFVDEPGDYRWEEVDRRN